MQPIQSVHVAGSKQMSAPKQHTITVQYLLMTLQCWGRSGNVCHSLQGTIILSFRWAQAYHTDLWDYVTHWEWKKANAWNCAWNCNVHPLWRSPPLCLSVRSSKMYREICQHILISPEVQVAACISLSSKLWLPTSMLTSIPHDIL